MSGRNAAGSAISWLAHPVSLGGLLLLLLNDHLFKPLWPGLVTGKLSDLAGMLVFPPLLATLLALVLPRIRPKTVAVVALGTTGCGFSAVKIDGYLAERASDLLTVVSGPSLLRADVPDLVALPALALAWLAFCQATRRAVPSRQARLVRAVILLPIALLGTTATSCGAVAPPVVAKDGAGTVWLVDYDGRSHLSSHDGGLTFQPATPPDGLVRSRQQCLEYICYQVVRGELRVLRSLDQGRTWRTDWQIGAGQRRDLAVAYQSCADGPDERVASESLVIVPYDGGHVVLVSNGRDGLLRRDTAGRWTRIGSFTEQGTNYPPAALSQGTLPGGNDSFVVAATVLILLLGGFGGIAIKARAPWRLTRWVVLFAVSAVAGICGNALVMTWGEKTHPATVYLVAAGSVAVLALAAWVGLRYRRVLHPYWTTSFLLLVPIVTVCAEALRRSGSVMGVLIEGPFRVVVMVIGFVACALIGIAAADGWEPVTPTRAG